MGQLDLMRHIKWSADDDWYYGSIETEGSDGILGALKVKVSRPWVTKVAMTVMNRLAGMRAAGVNVGAVANPATFQRLCQQVACGAAKKQIVDQYRNA